MNILTKVADIYVSDDGCSPYTVEICGGANADKFKIIGKELYYVCEVLTTTTTIPPVTTVSPVTTIPPATTVSPVTTIPPLTTASPTTTCPPSIYPTNIISLNAIYSQSSVWWQNLPATAQTMNNKTANELYATGTHTGARGTQWIKMDLNTIYRIEKVIIGCDFNYTLESGWGKYYTENNNVEFSLDNINWTTAFNTQLFCSPIQVYSVNFLARYIRILNTQTSYVAATEFAAAGALP